VLPDVPPVVVPPCELPPDEVDVLPDVDDQPLDPP
jgi:hypothetical protein